jgi:hypothetical protein
MKEPNKPESNSDHLFERFSDIDTYINMLKEFDKLDLTDKNSNEIAQIYFKYAPILPQIWFGQRIERFNNRSFYRVRKNIDPKKENLNQMSTYSYPNSILCTSNGRANLKGKSVFYCSDDPISSILESNLQTGDIGYLSIWKPEAVREIRIQYCLPHTLRSDNKWNEVRKDIHPLITDHLNKNYIEKKKHYVALINFLFFKFTSEKYPYALTSWLADKYLFGENWIDIILYPSVAGGAKDCNMAIHPNTVDRNIRFEKVIKFKVLEVKIDQIKYSPVSVGELVNQNIKWRIVQSNEKDFSTFK